MKGSSFARQPGPSRHWSRLAPGPGSGGLVLFVLPFRLRGVCFLPIPCAAPVPDPWVGVDLAQVSPRTCAPRLFIQNLQRVLSKSPQAAFETTKLRFCIKSPPPPRACCGRSFGRGGVPGGPGLVLCSFVWPSSLGCCAWLARLRPLPVRVAGWFGGRRPVAGFGSPRAVCPALGLRLLIVAPALRLSPAPGSSPLSPVRARLLRSALLYLHPRPASSA